MAHLLVVDDEQAICWGLSKLAEKLGHTVTAASSAEEALDLPDTQTPDLVVLDIRLPGIDGLTAMPRFRARFGDVPIIVITAFGDLDNAVNAIRNGAFEYLTKPFDLKAAEHAITRALASSEEPADTRTSEQVAPPNELVGRSPQMQEVFKNIALVAPSNACVHLFGESGTGKELVARAIHRYSQRADGPFVPVHVASLSPTLAESELFGHERGAFTGADQPRPGLLRQADGGTVFLDEIADIAPAVQVKLLRALEYGEILPVGASQPVSTDFRLISATHGDLEKLVQQGAFRHDLYFRLVTYRITLPPLRHRDGDVELLANHFLASLAGDTPTGGLSEGLIDELAERPWYGNVREFRNAIEHALIKARGQAITIEHLPPPAARPTESMPTPENSLAALIGEWAEVQLRDDSDADDLYERFLDLVEPPLLEAAVEHFHSQVATAARRLGIHRTTLRKKLEQHGLRGSDQGE
ncbi:MAG: sigma-54 dependent transcriptional regulator [Pirellulales bacterium]|nr:sigma-54 dependent transcriptional regulator [Pirellulales bacterium]